MRSEDKWVEFNDQTVSDFSVKVVSNCSMCAPYSLKSIRNQDIPVECFGGQETIMSYDTFTRSKIPKTVEKTRNAYMLIYQRKVTQALNDLQQLPLETSGLGCNRLLDYVRLDNMRFLHEKKLFDPCYFNFLLQLLEISSESNIPGTIPRCEWMWQTSYLKFKSGPSLQTIQIATNFFLEVTSHAKDREILPRYVEQLQKVYKGNREASRWLASILINNKLIVPHFLLEAPINEVSST